MNDRAPAARGRPAPPPEGGCPGCVAQVIGRYDGGGAEQLAYNLAIGLAEMAVRSLAVALRSAGPRGDAAPANFRMVSLRADRWGPVGLALAGLRLRRLIRAEGIGVMHVHGAASLPFVVLATRGLRRRPRLLFTWHNSESILDSGGWRRRVMVWALRRCDGCSGSSRRVAAALRDRAGLPDVGVFHGSVPPCPRPAPASADPPRMLWAGRIVPPKDPQILIRAAARLRAEGLRFSLDLVGAPMAHTAWYLDETRAAVDRLGLGEVVRMPGPLPNVRLREMQAQAQIGVQTSHTEGLSLALLEFMMAGLAIVATDVGDTREAVEDGRSGILVPPRDEEALVEALRRTIRDPGLRSRLGAAARERAMRGYSLEAMARRAVGSYHAAFSGVP
jgi:glycosyltransferase involved in cell wall biosynthesis